MNILLISSGYPPDFSGSGKRIKMTLDLIKKKYPEINYEVITKTRNTNLNYSNEVIYTYKNHSYKSSNMSDIYKENFQNVSGNNNGKLDEEENNLQNKYNTPNLNEYTLGCNNEENNENEKFNSNNDFNNDFSKNENLSKRNERNKNKSFKLKSDSFVNKFINSNK